MSAPATDFGLSQIGQIAVTVSDLERAVRFYRDTLGMRFLFQAPPGMAFFDCGGIRLLLGLPEAAQGKRYSSILYYKVADIEKAYETLASRGVAFRGRPQLVAKLPDHDLWLAEFEDSEKNSLALMSEVRR